MKPENPNMMFGLGPITLHHEIVVRRYRAGRFLKVYASAPALQDLDIRSKFKELIEHDVFKIWQQVILLLTLKL